MSCWLERRTARCTSWSPTTTPPWTLPGPPAASSGGPFGSGPRRRTCSWPSAARAHRRGPPAATSTSRAVEASLWRASRISARRCCRSPCSPVCWSCRAPALWHERMVRGVRRQCSCGTRPALRGPTTAISTSSRTPRSRQSWCSTKPTLLVLLGRRPPERSSDCLSSARPPAANSQTLLCTLHSSTSQPLQCCLGPRRGALRWSSTSGGASF
mmetsp:Transcript_10612/g.28190  ORF Transcript_10612/g.28190 Transcript_10612/m.28190 type:complete len:213 (+) Transcript_10612:1286-1924(+)